MMFIIWSLLAFFAGLAIFIVTPWTAAKIAGEDWVEWVSGAYTWLAQTAATKSAIVERDGTLELISKRFDSEILGDKDKEHGDPRHHRDGFSVLSRLKNKSFGVALHDRAEYVSPLLAELGERAWRARENDEIGGTGGEMKDGICVDKASKLVDIARARHLTTGDADPEDGHESYIYTQISQEKFNERLSFGQTLMIVLGALGSMVAMFYLTTQTGGGGGSSAASSAPRTPAPSGDNSTSISLMLLVITLRQIGQVELKAFARKSAAVLWIALWILTWPLTALLLNGVIMAAIVFVIMTTVALIPPVGIALAGPSIPKSIGLILARGLWILAQLTVGRGILVRRKTGEYEHHKLHDVEQRVDRSATMRFPWGQQVEGEDDVGVAWKGQYDAIDNEVHFSLGTNDDVRVLSSVDVTINAVVDGSSHQVTTRSYSDVDELTGKVDLPDAEDILESSQPAVSTQVANSLSAAGSRVSDALSRGDGEVDEDDAKVDDPVDATEETVMDDADPATIEGVTVEIDMTVERDVDHDFETTLSDGSTLPIKGSVGDLFRFGWAPLGITEEKGKANMDPLTVDSSVLDNVDARSDGGTRLAPKNTRQGYQPYLKIPDDDDQYLVTLPQLWSWCQGTSESETVEQGRDKALSEHGGQQQIGMAVFSITVLASVVIGGAFGWLAAGGLG